MKTLLLAIQFLGASLLTLGFIAIVARAAALSPLPVVLLMALLPILSLLLTILSFNELATHIRRS